MERTVRVWIGNEFLEYDLEIPNDYKGTEDELYEEIVDDVLSTVSIEVL